MGDLKAITSVCGKRAYRQRVEQACLKHAPLAVKKLMRTFGVAHADWRWETMDTLLDKLLVEPRLDVLNEYFDLNKARSHAHT